MLKQQQIQQQQFYQDPVNGSYSNKARLLFGDSANGGLSWLAGNIEQLTVAQQMQHEQQQALR
jgi:hypothetical protein